GKHFSRFNFSEQIAFLYRVALVHADRFQITRDLRVECRLLISHHISWKRDAANDLATFWMNRLHRRRRRSRAKPFAACLKHGAREKTPAKSDVTPRSQRPQICRAGAPPAKLREGKRCAYPTTFVQCLFSHAAAFSRLNRT